MEPAPAPRSPVVLFTGFEPSGDDHASAVIAEMRRLDPEVRLFAWGGPKMESAGATILERTGDDAVMGMPGIQKIREHARINERIERWIVENTPDVLVPVDSPGANFPICKIAKKHGVRIVHLIAPQIWAWGRWRIAKLRRRTDLVLCVLPFEERFFRKRRVKAKFVGHPLFDQQPDWAALDAGANKYGGGSPRLALMPGSRPGELDKSFPILLDAFRELKKAYPRATGVVAATTPAVAKMLEQRAMDLGGLPDGLRIAFSDTDSIVRWCDLALVKSGTITLQIARQNRPMVVFYKSSPFAYYLVGKWLVTTKYFTLPNVLAHREIVPELVPHFGDHREIVAAARDLLDHPEKIATQRAELARVVDQYQGRNAAHAAARAIVDVARGRLEEAAGE
jgi:lipid-A-disaccharide synthase